MQITCTSATITGDSEGRVIVEIDCVTSVDEMSRREIDKVISEMRYNNDEYAVNEFVRVFDRKLILGALGIEE